MRIDGQLAKIGRFLELHGVPAATPELAGVAAPAFQGSALRPSELVLVHDSAGVQVRRAAASAPNAAVSAPAASGVPGVVALTALLRSVLEPIADGSDVHAKFKIVGVHVNDDVAQTQILFSLSATRPADTFEMHAAWTATWRQAGDATPRLIDLAASNYEETIARGDSGPTLFADCTEAVLAGDSSFASQLMRGPDYWLGRLEAALGTDVMGHSGLAVGDANGDGLDDIYLPQHGGLPNRLYMQNPDGTVRDRAAWAGVDWLDRSLGALFIDLDNDGDQDLVVGTTLGLLFHENDGSGRFTLRDIRHEARYAYSLTAADYDTDGDLDIYATRYSPVRDDPVAESVDVPKPIPYHDAENGAPNVLFRNDGQWRFTDATAETGLDIDNRRWSFAAAWHDYDLDGDQDLYVANDFGRNVLYRNNGGHFVNVAAAAGVEDVASGMSVAWGDVDGDGRDDLYVGNMFSAAGNRITDQPGFRPHSTAATRSDMRRMARGNSLFLTGADGTFHEVASERGVDMGRWAWSSLFVDIDNDGWQDVVVANGFLTAQNPDDL